MPRPNPAIWLLLLTLTGCGKEVTAISEAGTVPQPIPSPVSTPAPAPVAPVAPPTAPVAPAPPPVAPTPTPVTPPAPGTPPTPVNPTPPPPVVPPTPVAPVPAPVMPSPVVPTSIPPPVTPAPAPPKPPLILSLTLSASASTLVATWQTSAPADTQMFCGTSAGTYPLAAVDNGTAAPAIEHQAICAGLLPGTLYFVQASSTGPLGTATDTASRATLAPQLSIPVTGVSYSGFDAFNALGPCSMSGDTFYNARAADGRDYFTTDDTSGYWNCGYSTAFSNMQLDVFDGTFPAAAHTVNALPGFGSEGDATAPDSNSQKDSGLFAMAGNLFMATGHQINAGHCCTGRFVPGSPFYQGFGEIKMSPDFGRTWNNWQSPGTFSASGQTPTAAMFGSATPSPFATATFVMYGPDDGTLGYLEPLNRHDNADAYVYLIANEGCWNNCNVYYLARVARARLARLDPADYQYFTGGDGNLDASWSAGLASAVPILSAPGQLSEPNVQYIPALNRYIMLGFFYPEFASFNTAHTVWPVWEAPHPWGPWTLVSSRDWRFQGWYNPVILSSSAWTGTTPYILTTGDFAGKSYNMWYSTMTIQF